MTLAAGNDWFTATTARDTSKTGVVTTPGSSTSYTNAYATMYGRSATGTATTTTYTTAPTSVPYVKPGMVVTFRMGKYPVPEDALDAREVAFHLVPAQ